MNKKLTVILTAAGLVLGFGSGTALAAATASPPPGYCVTHGSGTSAAGNYVLYNWDHTACPAGTYGHNITGAQGPAGPAGAAGPSTAGATGLDVIEVTALPAGAGPTDAVCPNTHPYVLGGGGAAVGSKPNWIGIAVSKPITVNGATVPNGWEVEGVPDGAESFDAYALCAK